MSAWDSLASVLNQAVLSALGKPVLYLPAAPSALEVSITGIVETRVWQTATTEGPRQTLFVRLADLPSAPARGDRVTISGTVYKVFEVEADQAGGVALGLDRQ